MLQVSPGAAWQSCDPYLPSVLVSAALQFGQVRLQKSMDNLNQKADVERIRKDVLENLRQLSFAPGMLTLTASSSSRCFTSRGFQGASKEGLENMNQQSVMLGALPRASACCCCNMLRTGCHRLAQLEIILLAVTYDQPYGTTQNPSVLRCTMRKHADDRCAAAGLHSLIRHQGGDSNAMLHS